MDEILYLDKWEGEWRIDSEKEFLWLIEDETNICYLDFGDPTTVMGTRNYFMKIEELGIYIAEEDSTYYNYGNIGDTEQFMEYFLNYYTDDQTLIMKSIGKISLLKESDVYCYEAVEDFIRKYKDNSAGEDLIKFYGNEITSLHDEIANLTNEWDREGFVIGYYLGEEIFQVNNKLYYLTEKSYTYNTQYCWELQEVGDKCYKYFEDLREDD